MLTPDGIREHRFGVAFPGYDVEEVRRFLDEVATLVEQGPEVPRSERFAEIGAAATRVLEGADAAASELIVHGERRAAELESSAREQADELLRTARAQAEELRSQAQRELAAAQATRQDAAERARDAQRRQRELETAQELSVERVREAGRQVQRLLQDANRPRAALLAALEEARAQLGGVLGEADRHASERFDRVSEVATELEAELELPAAPPARPRQGDAARGRVRRTVGPSRS